MSKLTKHVVVQRDMPVVHTEVWQRTFLQDSRIEHGINLPKDIISDTCFNSIENFFISLCEYYSKNA